MAVVGATASGKTGLSLDLAERLGGEVVNTDAMQVYRGMDVGTAKLPGAERRGIPHHLLDTLTVREPATVAEFQGWARDVIDRLRGAGTTPVLVGGSALYTRAILDRFEFPGTDEAVRARLGAASSPSDGPAGAARPCSRERDPDAAARILPENGRRIVRALEVVELTGRPFSASLPILEYADPHTVQIGVDIDRETLDERIAARVDAMFAGGFVEEVRHLLDHGLAEGRTAPRAIGYREVVAHLRGELTEAGGPRADRAGHPAVRAPPGLVVPQGPAHRLAPVRRPRPASTRRSRRCDAVPEQDRSGARPPAPGQTGSMSEDVRRPRPAARAAGRGARRGQPQPRRHGGRRVLLAVPLQPPALPRRRRAAGGDAAPGDARARGLAAAAGRVGHRHRVRGRLRVGRGVQPRLRPAYGHPPSAARRAAARHWLPAPNGIHFHPPTSLWVARRAEQHR